MQRNDVRDYLLEFMESGFPERTVRRDLVIKPRTELINTVTGPRRAGKTFYFYQKMGELGKEDSLYLNFEDTRLMDVSFREFREILRLYREVSGKEPSYIFMDEVQNIKGWEHGVRDIYEKQRYGIFLTGSSSKLLSREIATQLRGRALGYLLLPFSFGEFLRAKGIGTSPEISGGKEAKIRNLLMEYLKYGGFPQVVFEEEMKERLLREFAETMLYRDVVERHGIKSIGVAKMLLNHMISGYGREMSINKMYNFMKSQSLSVGKDTVYAYSSYFIDSLSVFFLDRYSEKPRMRESWPKKVYLSDTGLARSADRDVEIGRSMENAVFLALKRLQNKENFEIFYHKNGGEVDFLILNGGKVDRLIQVTYDVEDPDVRKRELGALIKAFRRFGARSIEVITWDEEGTENIEGKVIRFVPLWKFLLRPSI